jgi:hypothetical protein
VFQPTTGARDISASESPMYVCPELEEAHPERQRRRKAK